MSGVNIGLPGLINGGPQIAAARAKLAKLEAERHQPLVGTLGAERVPPEVVPFTAKAKKAKAKPKRPPPDLPPWLQA